MVYVETEYLSRGKTAWFGTLPIKQCLDAHDNRGVVQWCYGALERGLARFQHDARRMGGNGGTPAEGGMCGFVVGHLVFVLSSSVLHSVIIV